MDIKFNWRRAPYLYGVCYILRDNTPDSGKTEASWEVMKSMLDSFPQLWNRAEEYVIVKRHEALTGKHDSNEPSLEKLMRQVLKEYRQERMKR